MKAVLVALLLGACEVQPPVGIGCTEELVQLFTVPGTDVVIVYQRTECLPGPPDIHP